MDLLLCATFYAVKRKRNHRNTDKILRIIRKINRRIVFIYNRQFRNPAISSEKIGKNEATKFVKNNSNDLRTRASKNNKCMKKKKMLFMKYVCLMQNRKWRSRMIICGQSMILSQIYSFFFFFLFICFFFSFYHCKKEKYERFPLLNRFPHFTKRRKYNFLLLNFLSTYYF